MKCLLFAIIYSICFSLLFTYIYTNYINPVAIKHKTTVKHKSEAITNNQNHRSVAMGEDARATGEHSFALGLNSKATEPYSYAIGDGAAAIDTYAIALGDYVVAGGGNAFATNDRTKAMGMGSASFGKETIARATYEVVIGSFNDTTYPIKDDYNFNVDNPAFVIGNGSGELMNGRSNAFSVYFNGRTIIGDGVPKAKLHVKKGNILVSDSSSGLILTSADDREWKVTVNNDGALKTERLPGEPSTR